MSGTSAPQAAPDALADRLRRIAGDERDAPLYISQRKHAALPSRRKGMRTGAAVGTLAVLALASGTLVLALLLAPEPPRLHQPLHQALAQYDSAATVIRDGSATTDSPALLGTLASFHHAEEADDDAGDWCVGFAHCPQELADLPLVAFAASDEDDEMLLVYSDGDKVLTASWSRGLLAEKSEEAPAVTPGVHVAAWQTVSGVVAVGTNADPGALAEAMLALPPEADYAPTSWEWLQDGARRMLGIS